MVSLIKAAASKSFPAEIALVLSNRPDAQGLVTAKDAGIATAAIDHKLYPDRESFERALQALLVEHNIELICLAGFMRVLTAWFVGQWSGRLINIHPALLPSYRGLHTHDRALADGVKIHGCTVHFVVPAMDEGPIIAQAAVAVRDDDTSATLGARVLEQEHVIYPMALGIVAAGQFSTEGNRVALTTQWQAPQALVAPAVKS